MACVIKFIFPFSLFVLLVNMSVTYAADIPDYPFVFVVGKADIDTAPNIAICSLSLRSIDPDPGKAESVIDGRLKSILATLSAKHISANDIESSHLDKQIMLGETRNGEPASIQGYDVSRRIKFTARQLDFLPSIELAFMGSPNVENINCQFDRTDRAVVEADLLTKAIHSARDQADKLAEPLGRHVTVAVAVSKLPFDSIARMLGLGGESLPPGFDRMFKKSISSDELLVPATIPLSVTVNVLFKME